MTTTHKPRTRHSTHPSFAARARGAALHSGGFSLIEVMVALVVCAIGLLGLAKMESLSIASTSVASSRSLAAIQASSLAATMHANPGYWASTAPASTTVSVAGGATTIVSSDASLSTVVASCSTIGTGSCAPNVMAAYDLQQWANALNTLLPGSFSTINCTVTAPITCTIQVQWTEKAVAANVQQAGNALAAPTYVLWVQP